MEVDTKSCSHDLKMTKDGRNCPGKCLQYSNSCCQQAIPVGCSTTATNCNQEGKEARWVFSHACPCPGSTSDGPAWRKDILPLQLVCSEIKIPTQAVKPRAQDKIKLNINPMRGRKASSWNSPNLPREAQWYVAFHVITFFELKETFM